MFQCEGNGACEASWPRDPTWALRNKGPTGGKHASHARRPSRRIPLNDLGVRGQARRCRRMIWLASCAAAARSVRPDRRASCSWRQEGTCLARRRTGYLERPASSPVSRRTWNLPRAAHLHAQHPTPPVPCTSSLACPAPAISDQTVSSLNPSWSSPSLAAGLSSSPSPPRLACPSLCLRAASLPPSPSLSLPLPLPLPSSPSVLSIYTLFSASPPPVSSLFSLSCTLHSLVSLPSSVVALDCFLRQIPIYVRHTPVHSKQSSSCTLMR